LHQFVLTSDAFVVAPGGIGTVLELVMVWQLLQVNHLRDTPLVLIGELWPGLVAWAREAMLTTDPPLASAKDLAIPKCVADGGAAIEILRAHRQSWQQQRPKSRGSRPRQRA
jgi:predicted Rossmann-fold nucleotide-binding protein